MAHIQEGRVQGLGFGVITVLIHGLQALKVCIDIDTAESLNNFQADNVGKLYERARLNMSVLLPIFLFVRGVRLCVGARSFPQNEGGGGQLCVPAGARVSS